MQKKKRKQIEKAVIWKKHPKANLGKWVFNAKKCLTLIHQCYRDVWFVLEIFDSLHGKQKKGRGEEGKGKKCNDI